MFTKHIWFILNYMTIKIIKYGYLLKHYIQSVSGCGNCLVPPLLSDLFMNNNSARLYLALLPNMHMILIQVFFLEM